MFWRLILPLSGAIALSLPAAAQQVDTADPDAFLYTAQTILLALGMAFAGYWAYEAFDTPPIKLDDGPTLPRYMTQPTQYRQGVTAYVGVCLLVYALIAYFHKPLLPLVRVVSPELYQTIENSMSDGSLPYPLVVIFSAAIFIALMKLDKDWNPLFVLRRVVHGWMSIPQLANALMMMARDELIVPIEARSKLADDPDTRYVTMEDFDKDRRSLDRHWAELCYIRFWLEHYRSQGTHFTFFNEPSFAWEQLQEDYRNVRNLVGPLKLGNIADANIFADVAGKVELLRRHYCRLAACFLVFRNQTRKGALKDAKEFGVTITPDLPRANPLRYTVIFFVAIMIAIYLGVSISAMSWDLLNGSSSSTINQDPDLITWWIGYALVIYGAPIFAVLLMRYLGWTIDAGQPNSYLVSYATVFLVALGVSVGCLVTAIKLNGTIPAAATSFHDLFLTRLKWGISPAIVAVYIAYHVDRQIDPLLPDVGSYEFWRLPQRLMTSLCFGLIVAGFSVLPALSLSSSFTAWPVDKQRMVIIGTIFIIGVIMALVGEFCLIKPKPATDG